MSDHMSHSPIPNGYSQHVSPCSSPGGMSSPSAMAHNGSSSLSHHKTSPSVTPSVTPTSQHFRQNQNIRPMMPSRPDHLGVQEVKSLLYLYFIIFFYCCNCEPPLWPIGVFINTQQLTTLS